MEAVLIIFISFLTIAGLLVIINLYNNKKKLLVAGFDLVEEKVDTKQVDEILEKTKTFSARDLDVLIKALEMQADVVCNSKFSLTETAKKAPDKK